MLTTEAIKAAVSIYDVAVSYTNLKGRGNKYIGLCPIHIERNPSFSIDTSKGIFTCFSCGAKGDIFGLVEQKEGITFKEAKDLIVATHLPHLMDGSELKYAAPSIKPNTIEATRLKDYTILPIETVSSSLNKYETNSLFQALLSYFNEEKLKYIFKLYSIGTTRTGAALYWQYSPNGYPCNAKAMKYGRDVKRLKDKPPFYPMAGNITGLFGARLLQLPEYDKALVFVFESEKNAILMHLANNEREAICLGLGGANGGSLTPYLHLFKGRELYLVPDNDIAGINGMIKRGEELDKAGIKNRVLDPDTVYSLNTQSVKGWDMGDEILTAMQTGEPINENQYYFESVPSILTEANINILINDKGYPVSWQ